MENICETQQNSFVWTHKSKSIKVNIYENYKIKIKTLEFLER